MSQIKAVQHKFSESASRRSSRSVGDSVQTTLMDHKTTTNKQATSTFTGLILTLVSALAVLALPAMIAGDTFATGSSITISLSGDPSINIPPTSEGKFSDSGDVTVTVNTTHAAGYGLKLAANGSYNPTSLDTSGGTSSSGTVGFTTLNSGTMIDADTFAAASNTQYNNKWGYRYNKTGSATANDDKYRPSPSTAGDTLDTTTNNSNNTYKLSIGARATIDTAMASYSNTFVFEVVANATPYTITYTDNSGEATGMPSPNPASGTSSGETATNAVSNTVPVRDGYTFKGWCSASTSDDTCSGTTYNPDGDGTNRDITLNQQSSTNNFTLYAMWKSSAASLYDMVAAAWEDEGSRTQALADLKTAIDASNSGVFKYNASVFGADSDATRSDGTKADIYYYRGILDTTVGSYGSDGDNAAHPNTVLLDANKNGADTSDTCWRIVRTTGSGGVKMIYQGKWTSANKCKNATTAAQVTTQAYAEKGTSAQSSYWYRNIHYVGYTFNNNMTDSATDTPVDTVFGSNSNYSTTNTTNSAIKKYIENTWFSTISSYESILEPSAGYCNDRTAYSNQSTSPTALTTITPYKTSGATMYFGANERNFVNDSAGPSLTCPRNVVDLYTASSASDGNKQLSKPVALLTADESAFAGSGRSSGNPTTYHANSYLRSGSSFWLLSPSNRNSNGNANEFDLGSDGSLGISDVGNTDGVRPAISLASGTSAASGTGTATDPWVVIAP